MHASRTAAASIAALVLAACLERAGSGQERAGSDDSSGRAAIAAALDEPDDLRRAARLSETLAGLPTGETEAIRDLMVGNPSRELRDVESLLLLEAWSRREPRDAAEWALRNAPMAHRGAAVAIGVRAWARSDPEEVVRELRVTGAYASDPHVVTALVRGWFDSGQPGIETYLRDLGQGFEQQRAIAILTRERIRRDGTDAAMRWAEQTSAEGSERFKLALIRQVGAELAFADPRAGVAWCEAHCDGPYGDALRQLVATQWAARDAPAAFTWLEESPEVDAKQRERALRAAFRAGVVRDRERALAWMESLDESERSKPWRQPALAIFVNAIAEDRPEDALAWTSYLLDAEQREATRIAVARRWRARDEVAAERWLAESPLSEAARDRVRRISDPVPGASRPIGQ